MKKLSLMLCLWIVGIVVLGGCKKPANDDQNLDDYNTVKSAKFVITTTNLAANDNFSIQFTGGDTQGAAQTMFKVNGAVQANQRTFFLTYAQLKAGVTVESTTPLNTITVLISGYSVTAGHTFSFLLKPVINGAAGKDVSATLNSTTSYTELFDYK